MKTLKDIENKFDTIIRKYDSEAFEAHDLKCYDAFYHYDERFTEEEMNENFDLFCDREYEDFTEDVKEEMNWWTFDELIERIWRSSSFYCWKYTDDYVYNWGMLYDIINDEVRDLLILDHWYRIEVYNDELIISKFDWGWEEIENEEIENILIENVIEDLEDEVKYRVEKQVKLWEILKWYKEKELEHYKDFLDYRFEEKEEEREEREEELIEDIEKIFPELQGSITEEKRKALIEFIDRN